MAYSRVFFDVGATLLSPARAEGGVFAEIANEFGVQIDPDAVQLLVPQMYQLYEQLYEQDDSFWNDGIRAKAIWLEMYGFLCSLLDIAQEKRAVISNAVYEFYFSPGAWDVYSDVLPTLDALQARGIKMGLISNWDNSLMAIIEGMGMSHYFDTVIASAAVKMHKPMPEIFELALSKANVQASQALHVGDHRTADVAGAAAVGITPVLVDRQNRHPDEQCLRVTNLTELIAIATCETG